MHSAPLDLRSKEGDVIIAKIIGIVWMLFWFVIVFRQFVSLCNEGRDVFGVFIASIFVWALVAVAPIVIIKFGWSYIS